MQPQPRKPARQAFAPSGSQSHERIPAQAAHRAGLVYTHTHKRTNTHSNKHTITNTDTHTVTHTHRHTDTNRVPHKHAQTHTPQLERRTGKNKRALPRVPAPKKPTWLHRRAKPLRPRSHCGQECSCGPWSRQGSSAATKPQSIRPRRAAQGHQAQCPLPGETRTLQRRINMDPDRRRPMRTLGRKAGTDSEQRRKEEVPKSVHLLQGPEVQSQRRLPADAERERHPARARHLPENQDTTTERRRRFRRGKIAAGQGSEHRGQPDPSVAKPPCAFHHDRHAKLSKEEDHTIYSTSRLACQEHFRGALQLIPMTGDGNCLFHALAYRTRENAVHLRKDIIQFLRDAAQDQHDEEQEEAWLEEAAYLRGNANWGGDTAIVAFTLMRNQRVMLHWRGVDHRIHTDERTHRNVTMNLDAPDEDITHLWYNGEDHYDLLLPKPRAKQQHRRPTAQLGEGPPPPVAAPRAEPRPPSATRRRPSAQRTKNGKGAAPGQSPQRPLGAPSHSPSRKTLCSKSSRTSKWHRIGRRPSPKKEDALRGRGLAAGLLRLRALHVVLRSRHTSNKNTRRSSSSSRGTCRSPSRKTRWRASTRRPWQGETRRWRAARATARRSGASRRPPARTTWSRSSASAARASTRRIRWRSLLNPRNGEEHHEATVNLHQLLSRDKYFRRYDDLGGGVKLSEANDFKQWSAEIPGLGKLLCCPEDLRCPANPQHSKERVLCEHCEVPLCQDCEKHLVEGKLPRLSLCNDMWTGFAPERLHSEKITVMEMICASPCVTTLICMSMEARHRSEGTTLDEKAYCARHRLGARGNALTFPLPWKDVLRNLQAHDAHQNEGPAQLPRAGQDLPAPSASTKPARPAMRRSRPCCTRPPCTGRWSCS